MNQQESMVLFHRMHPDFFEKENIRNLPEECVFEEMILPLREFDMAGSDPKTGDTVSFGFYNGDLEELKKKVEAVEPHWVPFYGEKCRIYCGYIGKDVVSFCLVDDMGTYRIGGRTIRVGGPGCVGTLPEHRRRGIGSAMIRNVTRMLRDEGFDYSYIHFTGVAPWYEKLGYKTTIRWNKNGIQT